MLSVTEYFIVGTEWISFVLECDLESVWKSAWLAFDYIFEINRFSWAELGHDGLSSIYLYATVSSR